MGSLAEPEMEFLVHVIYGGNELRKSLEGSEVCRIRQGEKVSKDVLSGEV